MRIDIFVEIFIFEERRVKGFSKRTKKEERRFWEKGNRGIDLSTKFKENSKISMFIIECHIFCYSASICLKRVLYLGPDMDN